MRLKRLVVQGFKSFKDRTTIHFNDGITGIVGPNGCGKSNIVDALFWAMGEQSAKHLRGNGMKDLIFAGSSKYSPASWAEVTLILDNEEGKHIHIGSNIARPTEIALTRKLYRNGETEYRINNEQARLRDIQEVFMGTGAGAKSYSIIAQGEIDRLIQAKPLERRFIIEEVAGVTRFKARKKESLRKIEQTESNLLRLRDLRESIEKNLKSLRQQAERAERAKGIKEKMRKNELIVCAHRVFDILRGHKFSREIIREKSQELERLKQERDELEASLEGERKQKEKEASHIEDLRYEYGKVSQSLAASRERHSLLSRQKASTERELDMRQEEMEELEENLEGREEKLKELQGKKNGLIREANMGHGLEEMKDAVDRLDGEILLRENEIDTIKDELGRINDLKGQKNQEIFKVESALEAYGENLEDVNEELDSLERISSRFSGKRTSERDLLVSMKEEGHRLEKEEGKKKKALEGVSKKIKGLQEELHQKSSDLAQAKITKESLLAMNYSLEGTRDFLKEHANGPYEVLGRLIRVDNKYAKGVAVLMGQVAGAMFSKDKNHDEFRSWLKENKKGIDFALMDSAPEEDKTWEQLKSLGFRNVRPLHQVVQWEKEDIDIGRMNSLFHGLYLVDDIGFKECERIPTEIDFRAMAQADGSVVVRNQGRSKIYSSIPPNGREGTWVERNERVDCLNKTIAKLEREIPDLKEELGEKEQSLLSAQEAHESVKAKLVGKKMEYVAQKSEVDTRDESQKEVIFRIGILKNRRSKISKDRVEFMEKKERAYVFLEDLTKKEDSKQETYEALLCDEEQLRHEHKQKRDEYIQHKMGIDSYADRVESLDSQMEDIKDQMVRERERQQVCGERVQTYESEVHEAEEELISLKKEIESMSFDIEEREALVLASKKKLDLLSEELNKKEKEIRDKESGINRNEKMVIEHKGKMENYLTEEEKYSRDIFEKYHVDLRAGLKESSGYEDSDFDDFADLSSMYVMEAAEGPVEVERKRFEFTRKYGKELTECQQKFRQYKSENARLGHINWEAVEEYERQRLRWDFLKSQESELKRSLEDLEKAIVHIDERSKKRFRTAFQEVNGRFEKVFPLVFGGGNARLEIAGDLNDPECGVDIVAQPPGKKMQNINLMSGGEKALTAVGLIFSIFLVRPSPFCLLDEVDAPLDDANVGRFNELLQEMSKESQFILVTHNKKTMESNNTLYGVTMQEPGISKAVSVRLH